MKPEPLGLTLEFAAEAAWRAGRVTLGHFQSGVVAEKKDDASPVTVADRETERLLRAAIETRHPGDGILGEEFGETGSGARRRWILDPIDGTRSFVHGVPLYGVMIALEEAGDPVLGVVHFPALGEILYAARGEGAWWGGLRARVSEVSRVDEALVLTSSAESLGRHGRAEGWARLTAAANMARTWGDCYGYALVATGRAEAMCDAKMAVWDAAPIFPIIEEAGGVVTDWAGRRSHTSGDTIATNAALDTAVRQLLTAAGADSRNSTSRSE